MAAACTAYAMLMESAGQPAIDDARIHAERLEYLNLTLAARHLPAAQNCKSRRATVRNSPLKAEDIVDQVVSI